MDLPVTNLLYPFLNLLGDVCSLQSTWGLVYLHDSATTR